jgi:hypothetical protein
MRARTSYSSILISARVVLIIFLAIAVLSVFVFSNPKWTIPDVPVSGSFKLPKGNGISLLTFVEVKGGRYYPARLGNWGYDPYHVVASLCVGPDLYSHYAVTLPNDNSFTMQIEYGVWRDTYTSGGGITITGCSQTQIDCQSGPVTIRAWESISLDITTCQ